MICILSRSPAPAELSQGRHQSACSPASVQPCVLATIWMRMLEMEAPSCRSASVQPDILTMDGSAMMVHAAMRQSSFKNRDYVPDRDLVFGESYFRISKRNFPEFRNRRQVGCGHATSRFTLQAASRAKPFRLHLFSSLRVSYLIASDSDGITACLFENKSSCPGVYHFVS